LAGGASLKADPAANRRGYPLWSRPTTSALNEEPEFSASAKEMCTVKRNRSAAEVAYGQKRRFVDVGLTSALPLKADIHRRGRHVSNVPNGDIATPTRNEKGRQLRRSLEGKSPMTMMPPTIVITATSTPSVMMTATTAMAPPVTTAMTMAALHEND
jgi:hypothetical protein